MTEAFAIVTDLYAIAYPTDYFIHDLGVKQLKDWREKDYVPTNVPDRALDEIETELAGGTYEESANLPEARGESQEQESLPPLSPPPSVKAKKKSKKKKGE